MRWLQKTEADRKQAIGKAPDRDAECTDLVLKYSTSGKKNKGKMTSVSKWVSKWISLIEKIT